jgi:hypothetical protein
MNSDQIYTHIHFIDNKYNTLYFKIINNAKNRSENSGYTEKHHIIPRSMGGNNKRTNLVVLTAREHFICHYLLIKFTISTSKSSMYHAFNKMKPNKSLNLRYFNSRLFASIKEDYAKIISKLHKGKIVSKETRQKLANRKIGTKHSEESKEKMSKSQKGKSFSEETREKISKARKGKPSHRKGTKLSLEDKSKIPKRIWMKNSTHYLTILMNASDEKTLLTYGFERGRGTSGYVTIRYTEVSHYLNWAVDIN